MPISRQEEWIAIAELDDQDRIRFTPQFQALVGDLGWGAKAFVGHLLGLWYDPFEHLLDYTSGEATCSQDQPGEFDRNGLEESQDVVEYWAMNWSRNGRFHDPPHHAGTGLGLGVGWYCDVLRAKLASLRLSRRLLLEYKERILESTSLKSIVHAEEDQCRVSDSRELSSLAPVSLAWPPPGSSGGPRCRSRSSTARITTCSSRCSTRWRRLR
jgi:hypothetical protein